MQRRRAPADDSGAADEGERSGCGGESAKGDGLRRHSRSAPHITLSHSVLLPHGCEMMIHMSRSAEHDDYNNNGLC